MQTLVDVCLIHWWLGRKVFFPAPGMHFCRWTYRGRLSLLLCLILNHQRLLQMFILSPVLTFSPRVPTSWSLILLLIMIALRDTFPALTHTRCGERYSITPQCPSRFLSLSSDWCRGCCVVKKLKCHEIKECPWAELCSCCSRRTTCCETKTLFNTK